MTSAPPPLFADVPPLFPPYLPSFEEATAIGGGSLRLPRYRESYIRRYHPYIRWIRAPTRPAICFIDPTATIAKIVGSNMEQRPSSPVNISAVHETVLDGNENEVAIPQATHQQGEESDITRLLDSVSSRLRRIDLRDKGTDDQDTN